MQNSKQWLKALSELFPELKLEASLLIDHTSIHIGSSVYTEFVKNLHSEQLRLTMANLFESTIDEFLNGKYEDLESIVKYSPSNKMTVAKAQNWLDAHDHLTTARSGENFRDRLFRNIRNQALLLESLGIKFEYESGAFNTKRRELPGHIIIPNGLHDSTIEVIVDGTNDLLRVLKEAQDKHGLDRGWKLPPTGAENDGRYFVDTDGCIKALIEHLKKGDVLDSIAYLHYIYNLVGDEKVEELSSAIKELMQCSDT